MSSNLVIPTPHHPVNPADPASIVLDGTNATLRPTFDPKADTFSIHLWKNVEQAGTHDGFRHADEPLGTIDTFLTGFGIRALTPTEAVLLYAGLVQAEQTAQVRRTLINGRQVADYTDLRSSPDHSHTSDTIVGYVVRETVRNGRPLFRGTPDAHGIHPECGFDVEAIDGGHRYADTFATRNSYQSTDGGYAVVDTLYACGCRS